MSILRPTPHFIELSVAPWSTRFLTPDILILVTFLTSVTFVQFRGRVRHKLSRLVADHANLLAPYNSLMYLFSSVKAKPYADVRGVS